MIDYDKLKTAVELCKNIDDWYFSVHCCVRFGTDAILIDLINEVTDETKSLYTLNELIDCLRQLTQSEPKYKNAWYVGSGGHAKCTKVLNQEGYAACEETHNEAIGLHVTMYQTKLELIEAQISHWCKMAEQEAGVYEPPFEGEVKGFAVTPDTLKSLLREECQHESDGLCYTSCPPQWKCIKCGEFL